MQLTERAESTLQAERARLAEDLARERERLKAAEDLAASLEAQLEDARKPWYRKLLFGG